MHQMKGKHEIESGRHAGADESPGHRFRIALKASTMISSFLRRFVVPSMAAKALAMSRYGAGLPSCHVTACTQKEFMVCALWCFFRPELHLQLVSAARLIQSSVVKTLLRTAGNILAQWQGGMFCAYPVLRLLGLLGQSRCLR